VKKLPGEILVAAGESGFTLTAADGTELFVRRWLPDKPAKSVVQIIHGLAEHGARYGRFAAALNEHGYAVYANDHRGHGKTAKTSEDLGFFAARDGWRKCLDDLWLLHQRIAADHPGLSIILLGHSMGSTMARQFIMEHGDSLAGAVLSGPSGQPAATAALGRAITRLERLRLGPRGRSRIISNLTFDGFNKTFAPARTPFDWLSRDPAEVDKYVADPLCGFPAGVQLWVEMLDAWKEISSPASCRRVPKNLPLYVIAGQRDPVSGAGKQIEPMIAAYRAAGLEQIECRIYPEARHELLNETNRDEVTRDLIAWLDRVTSPRAQ
jgi:alpha-beta hydrolase superfamily lysophospholipase